MMDMKNDIIEKLNEKGFTADNETVDMVMKNFENALILNGYWDILEQTIEESEPKRKVLTNEQLRVGKEYKILPVSHIKTTLQNKKVKIEKIENEGSVFPVVVNVLEGRMKGSTVSVDVESLAEIE